jgi:basic amino acid/polyamine antiporter, APA family
MGLVNVAEEAKNPRRDMPRAIIISLAILTFLYLLVSTIAGLGLTPQELDQSDAPLADVLAKEGEWYPEIISAISLIAIINGVLVQIVMIARVMYGMAKKDMAPPLFKKINPVTRTPIWSTILSVVAILILALMFNLESLAEITNYILITVFIMINLALWRIKLRQDEVPSGVRTYPLAVPIIGTVLNLAVLIFQIGNALS